MNIRIKRLLSLFHLKDIEMELFEKVLEDGIISATTLARETNITRTSVYDYLNRLKERGLVTQTLKGGVRKFCVESPEKIQMLLMEQEKNFASAREAIIDIKNAYGKNQARIRPFLQLFEGRDELQQMMKDLLLYQNITVCVYWPILDIIKLLTPQFLEEFHKERLKRNITLKTIWPRTQVPSLKQHPFLKIGNQNKREVRLAPKGVDFSLGYALYENKVRFISSSRESFGFIITSNEFAQMIKGQFDIIWENSKPINFKS
ncbi:MAG: helix-turn-helix domain-containing protein [Patescibacteria group bacterium]|jgi:sugar-specific transcriptional regulator TrmB